MNRVYGIPSPQPLRKDDFVDIPNNRTMLRYYLALFQHFSYANNFGLALDDDDRAGRRGKSILLSKLFVAPRLSAGHIRPEQLVEAEHGSKKDIPERNHFADVLREHQRLFILGDPGTGKSTLINWLMLELSYSGDSLLKTALGEAVPFAFILRDMQLTEVSTWDDLWRSWCGANPVFGPIMADDPATVEQVFSSGQALFLLDGLDEITNRDTRTGLGRAVLDGLARYPRCRFVITSRLLGFSQEELLGISSEPLGFGEQPFGTSRFGGGAELLPVRYLTPFDPDQVSAFCRNWHSQYVDQDRQQRFSDLLERLRLNDGLARLARIPVLLNIICFIHARRGRLPDGRAELYRRIAETYLTALDTARGIRFRDRALQFDYYELHSWLGQIALEIQQGRGNKGKKGKEGDEGHDTVVIGEKRVTAIFRQGILDTGLSEDEAEAETAFILDYIAERSGLFIPRGEAEDEEGKSETLYAFTHLSFMEYFAAARLRSEVEFWRNWDNKDGAEWVALRRMMERPAWKEVFVLLFELMENPRQTEQYLARLIGGKPDIVPSSDNFMPVLEEPHQIDDTCWPGFYAWAMLAGIVMDTAIKMPPRVRQGYIRLLWRFVLSGNAQESWSVYDGVGFVLEHLWNGQPDSLAEFQRQAADMEGLRLSGRAISDPAPLHGLVKLKQLVLYGTDVNELGPLSGLVKLKVLLLLGTKVNDLTPLCGLVNLKGLSLHNAEINDPTPLRGLVNLEYLDLRSSTINDLAPLSRLVNLKELYLRNTEINDLTPLSKLVNLKKLDLEGTKVSKSDVRELRKKLKDTEVIH